MIIGHDEQDIWLHRKPNCGYVQSLPDGQC